MKLLPPTSPCLNPIIHSSGCYLVIQTRYGSPQLWITNISAPKTGVNSCGLLTENFPSEERHCITKTARFAGSKHTNPYSYLAAEQLHCPKTKLAHLEYNFNAFPTCCHACTELHMPVHPPHFFTCWKHEYKYCLTLSCSQESSYTSDFVRRNIQGEARKWQAIVERWLNLC